MARDLGMLVADLRERMSSREWLAWYVFYQREAQRKELRARRAGG